VGRNVGDSVTDGVRVAVARGVGVSVGDMVAVAVDVGTVAVGVGVAVSGSLVAVGEEVAIAGVNVAGLLVAVGEAVAITGTDVAVTEGRIVGEEVGAVVIVTTGVATATAAVGVVVGVSDSWPLVADASHRPRLTVASTKITGNTAVHPLLRSGACDVMRPPVMSHHRVMQRVVSSQRSATQN